MILSANHIYKFIVKKVILKILKIIENREEASRKYRKKEDEETEIEE